MSREAQCFHFKSYFIRFRPITTVLLPFSQRTKDLFRFFPTPRGKFLVDTVHLMKTTGKKHSNHLAYDIWTGGILVNYGSYSRAQSKGIFNRRMKRERGWEERGNRTVMMLLQSFVPYVQHTPEGNKTYLLSIWCSPFSISMRYVCIDAIWRMFETFIAISAIKAIKKILLITSCFLCDRWVCSNKGVKKV